MQRDKFQIIKQVLESLPDIQTHIQWKAELQYYHVRDLFKLLMEQDLMMFDQDRYYITEKGKDLLDCLNKVYLELD